LVEIQWFPFPVGKPTGRRGGTGDEGEKGSDTLPAVVVAKVPGEATPNRIVVDASDDSWI